MGGGSRHSLFSQRFDHAVFGIYLLGGIVPIAALFWVVSKYVLPTYAPDSLGFLAWIGGGISLALLSLSVYFALRRITDTTLVRMRTDNQRLAALLVASREIGSGTDPDRILASANDGARQVSGSPRAALLLSNDPNKPLELRQADAESRRWFEGNAEALIELATEAEANGGKQAQAAGKQARVALTFRSAQSARGALIVEAAVGALSAEAMDALATIAGMASTALQRSDLEDAQRNFFAHVTELLVTALDGHVVGRRGHGGNVARTANRIAHELGLDVTRKERLHFAAMLHDLGMLKVDPARHLDAKSVRSHPVVGARMLSRIRLWEPLAAIVLHHHEHWDGRGYPEGRAGDAIPFEARIIALADAVDAMSRAEGQRAAKSPDEIVKELQNHRGTQFDPALVDAFLALHARGESGLE